MLVCLSGTNFSSRVYGAPPAGPEIVVAGLRVVGPGFGENRSELRAFNEEPGVALALGIKMPAGSAIIDLDEDNCKLTAIADDTGQDLLEQGRFGSFPKTSSDGSAGLIEIESKLRPAAGANAVTAEGTLIFTSSAGAKPVKIAKIKLETGFVMKVGTGSVTLKEVTPGDQKTAIELGMTRTMLRTVREVRFLDAKGVAMEANRGGSGYINEAAYINYEINSPTKPAAIEFVVWQGLKQETVPFKVKANFSLR
jgi:hypothetical protein